MKERGRTRRAGLPGADGRAKPGARAAEPLRAGISRLVLSRLERHTPPLLESLQLQILLGTTARAFGRKGKSIWYLPPERALRTYVDFTRACMQSGAGKSGERSLYRHAVRLGRLVRTVTGFRKQADLQRLVFYLYRGIGITMEGCLPGEILVSACRFSLCYTPRQCALMSCMDSGVIAGICGGGRLVFTERLTEGCGRCRAFFTQKGEHR